MTAQGFSISPQSRWPRAVVLVAALLPWCVLASPVRLELAQCESTVTDVPELSAKAVEQRLLSALTQATKAEQEKATLVPAGALEGSDVLLVAKLERKGDRFRLAFELQTKQAPRLSKRLTYELRSPQLSEGGVMAMARKLVTEAVKLEETRKTQAAAPPAVAVLSADPTAVGEHLAGNEAPVPGVPLESTAPSAAVEEAGNTHERGAPRPARGETRLDLGLAAGVNTPAGAFGVELEFRPIEWLGLQVAAGTGEWGYRVSPLLRVYPLGRKRFSPFVEAGASFNLGNEATVTDGDGASQSVELLFTPVAVVGLGVRGNLGAHAFVAPRVGWGKRLVKDNIQATDGSAIDPSSELVSPLEQQEGLFFGVSAGVSFM